MRNAKSILLAATAVAAFTPVAARAVQVDSQPEPVYFGATDERVTSTFMAEPGVLVEAAGLERWTLEMIRDSLAASGGSLFANRASMNQLRTLPFFRQSVVHQDASDSIVTVFVAVIEDPTRVRVRAFGNDLAAFAAPWAALIEAAGAQHGILEHAVVASIRARAVGLRPRVAATDHADEPALRGVWAALDAHRSPADLEQARRSLYGAPAEHDRAGAIAILSGFPDEDVAWHSLAGALLDPSEAVRKRARAVLSEFGTAHTRRVDWSPAAEDLRALLDGSDLRFLPDLLDILVATGVGPDLAAPLLASGGHAVRVFAGARHPWARGPAHRFLWVVSGRDGGTPAEWEEWIAGLGP